MEIPIKLRKMEDEILKLKGEEREKTQVERRRAGKDHEDLSKPSIASQRRANIPGPV